MITDLPKERTSDNKVTDISKSFAHKMAAKISWHRYGTKLRHCHRMYWPLKKTTTESFYRQKSVHQNE